MVLGIKYSLFLIPDQFLNKYIFYLDFYLYFIIEIGFLNSALYCYTLLEITTSKSGLSFIWISELVSLTSLTDFVACLPQIEY